MNFFHPRVLLCVGLLGLISFAGCGGVFSRPPGQRRFAEKKEASRGRMGVHPAQPGLVPRLGIIESVDIPNRFVLLNLGTAPVPPARSQLLVFSGADQHPHAELVLSEHQKRPYVIANIVSGKPQSGDSVALRYSSDLGSPPEAPQVPADSVGSDPMVSPLVSPPAPLPEPLEAPARKP